MRDLRFRRRSGALARPAAEQRAVVAASSHAFHDAGSPGAAQAAAARYGFRTIGA
jgi:hypothetical protein